MPTALVARIAGRLAADARDSCILYPLVAAVVGLAVAHLVDVCSPLL